MRLDSLGTLMKIDLSKSTKRARLWLLTSILALASLVSFSASPPGTKGVVLIWDNTAPKPDAWFAYYTTNVTLPTNQWPLLAVITNPVPINGGAQLAYTNYLVPGAYFFTMTASNFWGSSPFSGAVGVPQPLPQPLLLNLGVSPGQ